MPYQKGNLCRNCLTCHRYPYWVTSRSYPAISYTTTKQTYRNLPPQIVAKEILGGAGRTFWAIMIVMVIW